MFRSLKKFASTRLFQVESPTSSFPLAASVRHAAKHALTGLKRVGGVFLAGVRPDSPSRSDTFMLLRVAARLRRGGRVGSYVVC